MRFPCPHCGSRSAIRSTNRMSSLTGILRCRCNNDDCGFVFQVGVEVTGYYVASALPNPAINLPKLSGVGRHWEPGVNFKDVAPLRSTIHPFKAVDTARSQCQPGAKEKETEEV
ncbi:MAG: ogr/Delta-like zinc finger family protein [Aeromonas veronii]